MIRILLPVHNESESIYNLLEKYSEFFNSYAKEHIIYVINDKSNDDTSTLIKKAIDDFGNLSIEYKENDVNKGLATTLKDNITIIIQTAEDNDVLITMDGDNTHNPFTILSMLLKIEEGADIVIASRYCEGSRITGLSNKRIILSRMARVLYTALWKINGVRDYTSNYRAYKVSLLKKLLQDKPSNFITESGFSGVGELLKNISVYNPIITEVPMLLNYSNKKNASNINITKTIIQTLKMLLIRWYKNYRIKCFLGKKCKEIAIKLKKMFIKLRLMV